ncbi:hypothetical protein A2W24_03745 [Microgenomates group bacterium RBG_16_45_19]|nr:MAG: hypothetical protein A2W24_03745 [Microgenomates group bacterium RBG_16_45_19]
MVRLPTKALAEYLAGLEFSDLPQDVVDMAKKVILDFFGYSIIAVKERPAQILFETVKELGGREESTIIGFEYKSSCPNAALVNGALGHMCELDDTHRTTMTHIGDSVIPAALAIAEREKSDGKKLITAVVAGYETVIRVGESVMPSHYSKGFHPTGTVNTFGAAVASAKVLSLDSNKMLHALGIAGSQVAGNFAHIRERAMTKDLHPGKAAMNGLYAALMAEKGFTSASDIFENEKGFCRLYSDEYNLEKITEELGKRFRILEVAFKPYSACRYCHAAIDGILELISKYSLSESNLRRIVIKMYSIAAWLVDDPSPWGKGFYGPRYSVQFNVALAITEGKAGLKKALENEKFLEEKLNDPQVRSLMKRITVVIHRSLDKEFPRKWSTIVEVRTANGEKYCSRVDFPKGEPENPMTQEELWEKFKILATEVLGKWKVDKIIEEVCNLERIGNITELTELLSP